jgi:hypothetical protein
MRHAPRLLALACLLATAAGPAHARPILQAGEFAEVDAQIARHGRQFYAINAAPFGLSLDAYVAPGSPDAKAAIDQFLAQDASDDFKAVTGKHVFEVVSRYGEYHDLGAFGGMGIVGTAFEYVALRRTNTDPAATARARSRVIRAAESWHVFYAVTGGQGLVARGIHRLTPEDPTAPPIPGAVPAPVPLFAADGTPLPAPKDNGSYRADLSGGALPKDTWLWVDSCSKDQLLGQVLGLVALYEAMAGDPDIDQSLVARLATDARKVGDMLMKRRALAPLETAAGFTDDLYDLIIMDPDGRATFFHDLNPLSLEKIYVSPDDGVFNLFNLIVSWAVVAGLHHVTGDETLEAYLYEDLLSGREYLTRLVEGEAAGAIDYVYNGVKTNFDNPEMVGQALFIMLFTERDAEVAAAAETYLHDGWWEPAGERFAARFAKEPLWHAFRLALSDRGADPALLDEYRALMATASLGPYWDEPRVNCDAAEIAAGSCLAVDGNTTLTLEGKGFYEDWSATEALDFANRPTSNYDARSNPFAVNSGGDPGRLNPGGDFLAGYWLLRALDLTAAGERNVSAHAREHIPVGGAVTPLPDAAPDAAPDTSPDGDTDAGTPEIPPGPDSAVEPGPSPPDSAPSDASSGCHGGGSAPPAPWPWLLALLVLLVRPLAALPVHFAARHSSATDAGSRRQIRREPGRDPACASRDRRRHR